MNKKIQKYAFYLLSFLVVVYPLFVWFNNRKLNFDEAFLQNLFPAFGLIAFTTLWIHIISGVFEERLRQIIDFDKFIHYTSLLILFSLIAHPLLLFINIDFEIFSLIKFGGIYIWIAVIAWLMLITYDIGKLLKRKYDFFGRHWKFILIFSTIGFLITFFHSIVIGGDLQEGFIRTLWIFYGLTAVIATIYNYGIKSFLKKEGAVEEEKEEWEEERNVEGE
jgi:hypothetical protein